MSSNGPNSVYTSIPIQGLIMDVDPDWAWRRIVVRSYVFSNGRAFFDREVPNQAYPWNADNEGGNGEYHAP